MRPAQQHRRILQILGFGITCNCSKGGATPTLVTLNRVWLASRRLIVASGIGAFEKSTTVSATVSTRSKAEVAILGQSQFNQTGPFLARPVKISWRTLRTVPMRNSRRMHRRWRYRSASVNPASRMMLRWVPGFKS